MRVLVIFLTLLSTSFGTYPGYVPAPIEVHQPVNVKSHSFATEVQHEVSVAGPANVAIHAPKSIHVAQDVVVPAAVGVHSPHSIYSPIAAVPAVSHEAVGIHVPKSVHSPGTLTTILKSAPVVPVDPYAVNSFSHASEIQHVAPVAVAAHAAIGAAPKSIHALEAIGPAPVVNVHAPLEIPAIKSFSYATDVKHEAPVAVPISAVVGAAPKSIHALGAVAAAPAVAPVVNIHAPKSIHTPVIKSFSYATEIKHDVPVVAPAAVAAAPKSIHAVGSIAAAPAFAPVVNIQAPLETPVVESFSYGTNVGHGAPIAAAPKSIHSFGSIGAVSGFAPVVNLHVPKSIHVPIEAPALNSFSYAAEVQHGAPVPLAVGAAPKSLHAIPSPAVSPVLDIHSTKSVLAPAAIGAPALTSFSYGTEVKHDAAVNLAAPLAATHAAHKSIHAPAIPAAAPLAIHANRFAYPHTIPSVLTGAVPVTAAKSYTTEIRKEVPLHVPLNYAPAAQVLHRAPVVVTSPVALRTAKLTSGLGYGHAVPIRGAHGLNIHGGIHRSHPGFYARIAAPGAYLWDGNTINNGVAYVAGTTGFSYRPVPVYYRNFANPTNAIYHHFNGK